MITWRRTAPLHVPACTDASFEAERRLAAVVNDALPIDGSELGDFMVDELAVGHEMPYPPSADGQMVGDDAPMASPPQSLRAHDRRADLTSGGA